MTETQPPRTRVYADAEPGNGDPIIALPFAPGGNSLTPILLGTGFESWRTAGREIRRAAETGDPSRNIDPENAAALHSRDPDEIALFSVAAWVDCEPMEEIDES